MTATLLPFAVPWQVRIGPIGNPHYQQIVSRPLFTPDVCASIVSLNAHDAWERAGITNDRLRAGGYDGKVRSADYQQLPNDDRWPRHDLATGLSEINAEVFRMDLDGLMDPDWPSVVRYDANRADHFRPHQDAGPMHPTRKLTFVVQLSAPDTYRGGDLVFPEVGSTAPRDQGELIAFPSTIQHTVTPVIDGSRHTLVGWVHGSTLR